MALAAELESSGKNRVEVASRGTESCEITIRITDFGRIVGFQDE